MNEMRTFNKQNSQAGKALVEYVLLLVIAIALIIGLANQLYRPFSSWMKDYMGQYIECLLDMGELPTIGGDTASGTCTSKFKAFTVQNGRQPISNDKNKSKSDSNDDESANKERVRRSDDASSSAGSNGSGGGRGHRSTAIGRNTGADGLGGGSNDKQLTETLPSSQYFKLKSSGSSLVGSETNAQDGKKEMILPMNQEKGLGKKEKSLKISAQDDSGSNGQSKKLIIKPQERKVANEADDQPWSFGQYIKFALILVIIIAIVLFLGGQILQISKGMEK